jgi:hypothetical protein|uniref:Uncharacterized protein n=1 Tax=Eutreptiella gymnastica TaxID=73025 RepID=A0A7S4FZ76_9EUGL|mmetsp:Transcript_43309/g.73067  ORF Transcript_43309/g.73067 Transcript_43309/m.73067 type:complete len:187 (+) Transcript_43309:119-679(+)
MGKKDRARAALKAAVAEGEVDAASVHIRPRSGAERHDELVERRDHFVETFVQRLSDSPELNAAFYAAASENEAKRAIRKEYRADACRFIDNTGHWLHAMAKLADQDEQISAHWAILRPPKAANSNSSAPAAQRDLPGLGPALSKGKFLSMPKDKKRKFLEENPDYNPKKGKWEPGVDHSHLVSKYC